MAVNSQFHTDGDIVGGIPLLDDLIGGIRTAFGVRPGQYDTFSMFQQVLQSSLPCEIAPGNRCDAKTGNIPHRQFGSKGRCRFFGVLAVEQHIIPHLDADELIRVLDFQIQIFLDIRGKIRFSGGSISHSRLLRRTRAGRF